MKKKKILDKIIEMTNKKYPDTEVYLFGSQTRGNSKKYSDWDILVLFDLTKIPFEYETKMMDDLYNIELETGEIITPIIYSKQDWNDNHYFSPLYRTIRQEGLRIK